MIESLQTAWNETKEMDSTKWIVSIAVLLILVMISVYLVMFFRNMAFGASDDLSEDLSMFRKLKNEGKLDEQEFQDLKSTIPYEIPLKNAVERKEGD